MAATLSAVASARAAAMAMSVVVQDAYFVTATSAWGAKSLGYQDLGYHQRRAPPIETQDRNLRGEL